MEAERRKKARLAIDAMIRGLEYDQISFHYDEGAMREAPAVGPSFAVPAAPSWPAGALEGEAA